MENQIFDFEKNSESTMHSLMIHPFTDEDFGGTAFAGGILSDLNELRDRYLETTDQEQKQSIWRTLVERLPQPLQM